VLDRVGKLGISEFLFSFVLDQLGHALDTGEDVMNSCATPPARISTFSIFWLRIISSSERTPKVE